MQTLANRMGSFEMCDELADAVLVYHVALTALRDAVLIEASVFSSEGTLRTATIAIGFLTGLTATRVHGIVDDPELCKREPISGQIRDLRSRALRLI